MSTPDPAVASSRSRLVVPALLAVAALLAAVVVVIMSTADGPGAAGAAAPTGPALRLADRAGLVTVGAAARADGLELTLIAPDIDEDPPVVRDVAVGTPGGPMRSVEAKPCGDGCLLAATSLPRGQVVARVHVAFAGRTDTARFRFPWPLPTDAAGLLARADERMARLPGVLVRERVTSDPPRGFFANPPRVVTGSRLAGTLGIAGAQDPRELPAAGSWRRVAYALPAAPMWIELWIGPDGIVRRHRIVGPNHLLHTTLIPRDTAPRR